MPRQDDTSVGGCGDSQAFRVLPQVGSGVGKEENEIPLDINYSALAQWTVDRKRVSGDWRKRLAALQVASHPEHIFAPLCRSRLSQPHWPTRSRTDPLRSGQGEQLRSEAPRGHCRGALQRFCRRRGRPDQT